MEVHIRDAEALASITPQAVTTYLHAHGWKQVRVLGDKGALWTDAGGYEALVPLRTNLGDYAARISDILVVLERVEGRSQLLLLADLLAAGTDE
jgi:hypothetical protein